ncbi:MAG: AAA family ATPase [Kineosporiaceae bacterium]
MSVTPPTTGLRGRQREREEFDRLLSAVRAHDSRRLVVRGEPGVGKSALLDYLESVAADCRVVRVTGVESELEFAFAGLHQLCAPMLDHIDRLPDPQRDALGTALGITTGVAPDRFLVGLATLSLLSDAAEQQPLVCLVDDAQWLDRASAQVLAFVARRLLAEAVAVVFAVREPHAEEELAGLPVLTVEGLSDEDARALLDAATLGRMDERVRDRVVAEARGNPLALLELPRGLGAAELAGGFGRPDAQPLAGRIERSFLRRLESLPGETRRLLLLAAAEPLGDPLLFWRAAEHLALRPGALLPAEAAGVLEIGARVRFRHPLVRSAAYRSADAAGRREVHGALAAVTDPAIDPERRAWHCAQAASGPDEEVAGNLERSADRAQARGGVAAAAAFLRRAAELTPDPARRGARAIAAAELLLEAAAPEVAADLLAAAGISPLDELQRARVARLRAQIVFVRRRGCDAPPLLLEAAQRLQPLDARLARDTYLDAFGAAVFAGRLAEPGEMGRIAAAARTAPAADDPPRPEDVLLDGLTVRFTEGYAAGVPPLRRALGAFRDAIGRGDAALLSRMWLVWMLAAELADAEMGLSLARGAAQLAQEAGALAGVPVTMEHQAAVLIYSGRLREASALVDDGPAIAAATGAAPFRFSAMLLAAWSGDDVRAAALTSSYVSEAQARGEGHLISFAAYTNAVLHAGHGRSEQALAAAREACEHDDLVVHNLSLAEVVEAGARHGSQDEAERALGLLEDRTRATGTEFGVAIAALSRALLRTGAEAESGYREAVERMGLGSARLHLARAHLVYGEWLRRENRRVDAREQLRVAHSMFDSFGVRGFAERARRELAATGGTVPVRAAEPSDVLTAQEAHIARLAAEGHTNPEIAARLFVSPRTVEYHLGKVYPKLGIGSRRELRTALPGRPAAAQL